MWAHPRKPEEAALRGSLHLYEAFFVVEILLWGSCSLSLFALKGGWGYVLS